MKLLSKTINDKFRLGPVNMIFEYAEEERRFRNSFFSSFICRSFVPNSEFSASRHYWIYMVSRNGSIARSPLRYAADEFKSDREIVLAAVQSTARMLEYAADELKSDREFVMAACKIDGNALKYAANEFKSDREIVLTAFQSNSQSKKLSHIRFSLFYETLNLDDVADLFKSDREIVLTAVKSDIRALKVAADEFKSDREIVLNA
eukprot:CAMPEP_0197308768 /NCGR_PEP_ID=MMETSP0891-20130614/7267_1 /TAXON_ID=44058 ORGANISM="Aureoumbra lagunensis, Strain CCMP1510" /NCGR_SAMPLE_ID=MMETSP0891 /ASSEMBLY_ACC=CAM_ASM_000534 /LENGTH=204 /DNA_ID=CAMNT_0042793441 /DNA_START=20 /DNA_END=630 /DNA_ORIENTATION=+